MKRTRTGSTLKQYAYAKRLMGAEGLTKEDIARSVGFSPSVAKNAHTKIEKTVGFQNALVQIGHETNNLMLAALAEFKARGLDGFSNKELVGAMNAITNAWDKVEKKREPNKEKDNPLRNAFGQKPIMIDVESNPSTQPEPVEEKPDLDF